MEMLIDAISWITIIVTVSSFIAASTPTPKDDIWIGKLYKLVDLLALNIGCLLYTSPSPRDGLLSRMPSSA